VDERIADLLDRRVRSSSVSSSLVNVNLLAELAARSRARRSIFWNVGLIGIMRSAIAVRCSSSVMRESWATLSLERRAAARSAGDGLDRSYGCCTITSSPTTSMSESSFSVLTRTVAPAADFRRGAIRRSHRGRQPEPVAASLANATGLIGIGTSPSRAQRSPALTVGRPPAHPRVQRRLWRQARQRRRGRGHALDRPDEAGTGTTLSGSCPFSSAKATCWVSAWSASRLFRISVTITELSVSWRLRAQVEHRLDLVGQSLHRHEPEEAGIAFEGMNERKIEFSASGSSGFCSRASNAASICCEVVNGFAVNSPKSSRSSSRRDRPAGGPWHLERHG